MSEMGHESHRTGHESDEQGGAGTRGHRGDERPSGRDNGGNL